jgi:hypothetical protein
MAPGTRHQVTTCTTTSISVAWRPNRVSAAAEPGQIEPASLGLTQRELSMAQAFDGWGSGNPTLQLHVTLEARH